MRLNHACTAAHARVCLPSYYYDGGGYSSEPKLNINVFTVGIPGGRNLLSGVLGEIIRVVVVNVSVRFSCDLVIVFC